jgi:hypothetical protein
MIPHAAPPPIIPNVPVGAGLNPGDASSVAPMGIPTGDVGEFGVMPSGEVAPIVGVGLGIPPTCAKTGSLPRISVSVAAISSRRIVIPLVLNELRSGFRA